jgi:aminopeptidase-like protein
LLVDIVDVVDRDRYMVNCEPYGEPQLGNRGLYRALGGTDIADEQLAMLWILNQADGQASLLAIAERSGISFDTIVRVAAVLEQHGLLEERAPN